MSRFAAGREALSSAGEGARGRGAAVGRAWSGLDVYARRRIGVAAVALVVLVVGLLLAVPSLPCGFPGGGQCAPPDRAASLVPADALAYAHVDVDPGSDQYGAASAIAAQLPTISSQLIARMVGTVPGLAASPAAYDAQVAPWIGDEAALALLPAAGRPQEIFLLEVANAGGAARYRARLEGKGARTVRYRGTKLELGRGGVATAIVHGFLLVGTRAGAQRAIDVASGAKGSPSLATSPVAEAARGMLPDQRVADAYLSPAGVSALAGRPTGALASLAPFVAPGSSKGVAFALAAGGGALELDIRSALDPARAKRRPGFFAAFPSFDPTLAGTLPTGTLAYAGFGRPADALSSLLAQAHTEEPGLARALTRTLVRARRAGHLNVARDLQPALGTEGALALEPGPAAGAPYVLYVGDGIQPNAARPALVRLQEPIAHALGAPRHAKFETTPIAGVTARTLAVSRSLQVSYAIVDGRLVVATDPSGIAAVAKGGGLGSSRAYEAALAGSPSTPSVVAYLGVHGLLTLAERAGLARDPAYAAFAPELRRLEALGISVAGSSDSLATDARLVIGGG